MCNLYSVTKGQQAIREWAGVMTDHVGNLPPMPGVYPDYAAPIVRNDPEGRVLAMARWGLPSPSGTLKGKTHDSGVTNIRNAQSPHWRRWLDLEHRCVVPFTSFAEPASGRLSSPNLVRPGSKPPPGVLRGYLGAPMDLCAEGQGRADNQRSLRLPHLRAKPTCGAVSPAGHASDPDHARRGRHLAHRSNARSPYTGGCCQGSEGGPG
jgi:hypothetical protein